MGVHIFKFSIYDRQLLFLGSNKALVVYLLGAYCHCTELQKPNCDLAVSEGVILGSPQQPLPSKGRQLFS